MCWHFWLSQDQKDEVKMTVAKSFPSLGPWSLGRRRAPHSGADGVGVARGVAGAKIAVDLDCRSRYTVNWKTDNMY